VEEKEEQKEEGRKEGREEGREGGKKGERTRDTPNVRGDNVVPQCKDKVVDAPCHVHLEATERNGKEWKD
jgi:hypothetical protein